jgi:phosphatidylserine decarboxylase
MRFAREGYVHMAVAVAVAVIAAFVAPWWVALSLVVLAALVVNFFRDPERLTPPGDHLVTSPADGRVVAVLDDVVEERFVKGPCKRVSIFMSPIDVHINRAPVSGTVREVVHTEGRFHAAYLDKASEHNERNAVVIEDTRGGRVLAIQIAGQLARRIVCNVKPGDVVRRGERYGMILFGSRLDLYVPRTVDIEVKVGDQVAAGTTVIGAYP